jgi:nicotinate-nucleotide--dimethylbenzimidazole phosphoribosyltransferase
MTFDVDDIGAEIDRPDEAARIAARAAVDVLVRPAGGLGRLGGLAVWLAAVQGRAVPAPLASPRLLVLAAEHGIAAAEVSAWPADATTRLVGRLLRAGSPTDVTARLAGLPVRVLDVGLDTEQAQVRRGTGRFDVEDALAREEVEQALDLGLRIVDEEVDSGTDLLVLGDVGVGATTAAAALVGLLTNSDAAAVTGRGSGIDDATWMRKCAAVRDGMRRARPLLGDRVGLLAALGGVETAVSVGVLLGAARRRTPVVLDGLVSAAAALVAQRIAFRSVDWWLAAQRTGEPAHELALDRLSMEPVLDLGVQVGEGFGAVQVVPLLLTASRLLAEVTPLAAPDAHPSPKQDHADIT